MAGQIRVATPADAGQIEAIYAPIVRDTTVRCETSSGSRSSQWSISARGTTSAWPGVTGLIERKTTHSSSLQTKWPGNSPSMMRVKIVGTHGA